jgi:hypothetical protein
MKKPKLEPKGAMLIRTVDFEFHDSRDPENWLIVRFCHDSRGKPEAIKFLTERSRVVEAYVIDNRNGRYKPCATHAAEILRTLTHKQPKSEFEKQRRAAASKPGLGVPLGSFKVFK